MRKAFTLIELLVIITIIGITFLIVASIHYEIKSNTFHGVIVNNKDPIGKEFIFCGNKIFVTDFSYNTLKYKIVITLNNSTVAVDADREQIQEAYAKSLSQNNVEKSNEHN